MSTKKKSQRIFAINSVKTEENLIKFGGLSPESTQDTTAVAFQTKPLPET